MSRAPDRLDAKTRVLGVDPGTRVLGYGILDVECGGQAEIVACGAVRLPPKPLAARLETIFREMYAVIEKHGPRVLSIEEVFYGKNFQSALKVGEARGVVVLAAQMLGLEIREYPPAVIKRAATGNGNADKTQVQRMMRRVLGLKTAAGPVDTTDALAAAFCHGQRLWRTSIERSRSRDGGDSRLPAGADPIGGGRSVLKGKGKGNEAETGKGKGARKGSSETPRRSRQPIRSGGAGRAALDALLRSSKARVVLGGRFRRTSRRKTSEKPRASG